MKEGLSIVRRMRVLLIALGAMALVGMGEERPVWGVQGREHEVHFPNTPYELNVYKIRGQEPGGPTLLIIGGIQGNEPGGFLSADRYVDLTLKKGNLILVPRANFYSILKNNRGVDGDMNRRFRDGAPRGYMDHIVEILKELMAEADYLLNLHDGSGFYSPWWEGPDRNPSRYGQSIIADAAIYTDPKTGKRLELEELAERVIQRVNPQIRDERHTFRFNNHRTLEKDTRHAEQRTSATHYALTRFGTPAYGVETSKDIPDHRVRVQYQTMVINAFMDEVGILPDHPPLTFDPPQLHYLLLSVNRGLTLALQDGEAFQIAPGDVIQIQAVMANYQRGITADVEGVGSESDLQKPLKIFKDTRILARKESQVFGQVRVLVREGRPSAPEVRARPVKSPKLNYFVLELNGEKRLVEDHGTLRAYHGDHLRILDVLTEGVAPDATKVNFIGFVKDEKDNTGEDRGALIRTARDLWRRYALDESGNRYRIVALQGNLLVGEMVLELQSPRLAYLVIGQSGAPHYCYPNGMAVRLGPEEELRILDVRTNIPGNHGVSLQFRGDTATIETREDGWILRAKDGATPQGEIVVTRDGIPMGHVTLQGL